MVGTSLLALTGCLLQNPAYGDQDGATGGGSSGSTMGGSTAAPTTGAVTGTDGSASATTGGGTGTGGATTGGDPTTGELSAGTGSTGQESTGGSTTADMPAVTCPGQEIMVTLSADEVFARDAFVVRTADPTCMWKNSDGQVLNQSAPCEVQNYGGYGARYTVIGELDGGEAQYLVSFGVAAGLQQNGIDPAGVTIEAAKLRIVAWWSTDRKPLTFHVGAIAPDDVWVEGNKSPGVALIGDSSWQYRWIEADDVKHAWTDPQGPAAASAEVATVEVPAMTKDEFAGHPYYESSAIGGWVIQPWLDPANERGFVVWIEDAPVLVKSKDTGFAPQLALVLCPKD